jgi:hypothetical protein
MTRGQIVLFQNSFQESVPVAAAAADLFYARTTETIGVALRAGTNCGSCLPN